MKKVFQYLLTITFVMSLFFGIPSVKAQQVEQRGLIVSPPSFVLNVEGGSKSTKTLFVTNRRGATERIYVYTKQVGIDEFGRYFTPAGYETDSRSDFERQGWIKISDGEFVLENGQSKSITLNFSFPEQLDTKGYYFEITVSTIPSTASGTVGTAPEVAIPVSVNYAGGGTTNRRLELRLFNTLERERLPETENREGVEKIVKDHEKNPKVVKVFDFAPVNLFAYVQNTGNANIIPAGSIFISRDSSFKDVIATLEVDREKRIIVNNSGRVLLSEWSGGLFQRNKEGNFQVDFSNLKDIRFGRYYAQLNLVWDGNNAKEFKTEVVEFWMFPWQLLVIALVVIISIVLAIVYSRKGKKVKVKKSKKE